MPHGQTERRQTNRRYEASTHFRKKKNIRDLYGGISELIRSNLVADENGDLIADSHHILNTRQNYFSQVLNVHDISDVRQIEVHTAKPLVPHPRHFDVEIAIAKLKKYKSPGSNQILAELIQAGGEILQKPRFD
jgi:hypothetical protein